MLTMPTGLREKPSRGLATSKSCTSCEVRFLLRNTRNSVFVARNDLVSDSSSFWTDNPEDALYFDDQIDAMSAEMILANAGYELTIDIFIPPNATR